MSSTLLPRKSILPNCCSIQRQSEPQQSATLERATRPLPKSKWWYQVKASILFCICDRSTVHAPLVMILNSRIGEPESLLQQYQARITDVAQQMIDLWKAPWAGL